MLFKLISDGKHTLLELDGKTLGGSVTRVNFSHDVNAGEDGRGDVQLDLTFNLRDVFDQEQTGQRYGIFDEGEFNEHVRNMEIRQKELYCEYSSAMEQKEEIKKVLQDDKSQSL